MKVLCKKTFFKSRQREGIRCYFFKDKYFYTEQEARKEKLKRISKAC